MDIEPELLNERLERLAIVLDEIMPQCAEFVRDAVTTLKKQEMQIDVQRKNLMTLLKETRIVRCNDCRFKHEEKGTCHNVNSICFGQYIHNNWFCADGKIK